MEGTAEAGGVGGLETDFDGVEGVADGELRDAGEDAGDEAFVVLARLFLHRGRFYHIGSHGCDGGGGMRFKRRGRFGEEGGRERELASIGLYHSYPRYYSEGNVSSSVGETDRTDLEGGSDEVSGVVFSPRHLGFLWLRLNPRSLFLTPTSASNPAQAL